MISSTQFLHYVVFKVRVPFDAEHLRLYAPKGSMSTTFLKFFQLFLTCKKPHKMLCILWGETQFH